MAGLVAGKVVAVFAILSSVLVTYGSAVGYSTNWQTARATWYGAPYGSGPGDNGGACGFKGTNKYPFMSMTSCGNKALFQGGAGCGACYQIKCHKNAECSNQPKTVMITDNNSQYPGYHFDLTGIAFGSMAKYGQTDRLLRAGMMEIDFRRVPCNHGNLKINFFVVPGSNPFYFAFLVQYVAGYGTVTKIDLKECNGRVSTMRRSWGSIWRYDSSHGPLKAPFTITMYNENGQRVVADKVIPPNWRPSTSYNSVVQFPNY